jgi:hypothetical protein
VENATGALTIIVGALMCVFLHDSPVKVKRFTDAEKVAALMRVKESQRLVSCSGVLRASSHNAVVERRTLA